MVHNSQKMVSVDEKVNKTCIYMQWNIVHLKKEVLAHIITGRNLDYIMLAK